MAGAKYIHSKNGRLYRLDALRESAPEWEGVKVYDNHLTDEEFNERAGMRSVAVTNSCAADDLGRADLVVSSLEGLEISVLEALFDR